MNDDMTIIQFQSPLQSLLIVNYAFIVADVQHNNDPHGGFHHFGLSIFCEDIERGIFVSRFRHTGLSTNDYKTMWQRFFVTLSNDTKYNERTLINSINAIVVDYSTAQMIEFLEYIKTIHDEVEAKNKTERLVRGCFTHFKRSLFRMANCIADDELERKHIEERVEKLIKQGENFETVKNESVKLINSFPKMNSWFEWWFKNDGLAMKILLNTMNSCHDMFNTTNLVESLSNKNRFETNTKSTIIKIQNQTQ